jgi:hypothetical protein
MHSSESAELSTCIVCGEEVFAERERSYLVTGDDILCYACALARGGVFDELHDRWTRAPKVDNLPLSPP